MQSFIQNFKQVFPSPFLKGKSTIIQKILEILFTWEDNTRRIKSDTSERPISFLSKMYLLQNQKETWNSFPAPISFHLRIQFRCKVGKSFVSHMHRSDVDITDTAFLHHYDDDVDLLHYYDLLVSFSCLVRVLPNVRKAYFKEHLSVAASKYKIFDTESYTKEVKL